MPKFKFAKLDPGDGPIIVGPPSAAVFAADEVPRCRQWFLPLLSLPLCAIDPGADETLHFIYCELGPKGESRFRLEAGHYRYLGDFSECNPESPLDDVVHWKAPRARLVEVAVPDASYAPDSPIRDRYPYWNDVASQIGSVDPELSIEFFFGGVPNWVQNDETPLDPDGRPMTFIGQMLADAVTENAAPTDIYLFYSRRHQLVSQIAQFY